LHGSICNLQADQVGPNGADETYGIRSRLELEMRQDETAPQFLKELAAPVIHNLATAVARRQPIR